ncbi:hypothetical protein Elgi_08400 [Paenibacillus elgii]|uniref:hypothetical protein n=1 Tax=Paenibacillus elgii TaxID=189691 RepID=UPI002D7CA994|nr:hypothetical protein Elgi_08400 [Paenibacillus elgii]
MKKTGRWILTSMIAASMALSFTPSSAKAAAGVKVMLPTYAVNVDGNKIDNIHLAYPLINYSGVTYFPLTWNVGAGLGLGISWSPDTGLSVQSHKPKQNELSMEAGPTHTQASYTAQIAPFPVTIDGQTISNETESYPLLTFRDVTYFPMTWEFTVNRFGWKTSWDDRTGYSIFTQQQSLVWDRLIYDDASFLYAAATYNGGNRIVKIPKDFQGVPELLNDEEAAKVRQLAYPSPELNTAKQTERKGDKLYGGGAELLDVKAHTEKHTALYGPGISDMQYDEHVVKMNTGSTVFNLALRAPLASMTIADPDTHTYFVKNGKSFEIQAFDKTIQGTENAEGGIWSWSYAPTTQKSGNPIGSSGSIGKVLWIDNEGNTRLWNDTLKAEQLRVLKADKHALIVEAYRLISPVTEPSAATQGYFRLQSDGSYEKLADYSNRHGYADRQGNLYELSGPNQIKNLTKNLSRQWKDSELASSQK